VLRESQNQPNTAWHWMGLANTMAQGAQAANMVEMGRKRTCL
jgi:hypothetical protein